MCSAGCAGRCALDRAAAVPCAGAARVAAAVLGGAGRGRCGARRCGTLGGGTLALLWDRWLPGRGWVCGSLAVRRPSLAPPSRQALRAAPLATAAAVAAVLERRGYRHACIVGHSYGTFVASRLCQLHPKVCAQEGPGGAGYLQGRRAAASLARPPTICPCPRPAPCLPASPVCAQVVHSVCLLDPVAMMTCHPQVGLPG